MARIFLLPPPPFDPSAIPGSAGVMLDANSYGDEKAKFIPLPNLTTALLYQPVDDEYPFPGGSAGALIIAGVQAGLSGGYHINDFTHNGPDINEQGVIDVDVTLSWELDFSDLHVLSYTLDGPGGPIAIAPGETSYVLTGANIGATATWVLTANVPYGVVTATCIYPFGFRIYHGRGGEADLTESTIEALAADLATEPMTEYVFAENTAGSSEAYLWISYPEEFGPVQRLRDKDTLLPVEFMDAGSVNVTNSYSVARLYRICRSVNAINGFIMLEEY